MYGLGFEFGFSVSGSRVSVFLSWVTLDLRHILGHVGRGMELGHMSYRTSHARSATLYIFNRGSSSRRCFSPECRFGAEGLFYVPRALLHVFGLALLTVGLCLGVQVLLISWAPPRQNT